MVVVPAWLAAPDGSEKKRRGPFTRTCLFVVAGLIAIVFLAYSMAYIFFEDLVPSIIPTSKQGDETAAMVSQEPVHSPQTTPESEPEQEQEPESEPEPLITMDVSQPESVNWLHWDSRLYNDDEKYGLRPQQTFHSSDIKTPLFQVNTFKPHAADGNPYIFMTPSVKDQSSGVQIFSRKDLSLVYAQYGWKSTNNFRPQEFNGKQYLSFWQGQPATGHGLGQGILLDEHYDVAYNISINAFNSRADSHEFQLTHDGGAMFSVYETVRNWDMRPVGGPEDGVLQDSAFEEVDVVTGETRFAWRASDWFSIEDTTVGYNDVEDYGHPTHGDGWDFFHINSLEKTRDGNYLVSGRRCKVLTLINGTSGAPIWIIGGKRNQYADLSDGMATNFAYQHHARFDNDDDTEIVMFDNAQLANTQPSPGCQAECSRGLHIRMNHENKTAEVVRSYWHPKSVQARAEGGVDRQPNGNLLVGWGKVPGFTEFSREGEVLLDVQTGPWAADGDAHVYRIFSRDWEAYPPWDPEVALFENNLYVSWNGATELAYWAMYTGETREDLKVGKVVYRGGFETKFSIPAEAKYARFAGLDAEGKLLGSSDIIDTQSGERVKAPGPSEISFTLNPHTLV